MTTLQLTGAGGRLAGTPTRPRRPGLVSLVGAGPGDPELLTQRAVRHLGEADVVFYDALVDPAVLAYASRAQCVCVGKRHGRHSVSQATINRCLVSAARRGRRVVRLKCGDPFVFGRGGEEGLALAGAGVPFEIVPGLSTAIAAPSLAGIPVTHRGLTASLLVLSGHSPSAWRPIVDTLPPGLTTLVVLMGVRTRGQLADDLLARGWSPSTPAALVFGASTQAARRWLGTLATVDNAPFDEAEDAQAPGTLVIGEVVALAPVLGAGTVMQEVVAATTSSGEAGTARTRSIAR